MTQSEERLPLQSPDSARRYLFAGMVKFANLLPQGEKDAKRFLTIAMSVLTQKPDLLRKASRETVLNCLIECARLRLDPEGTLGHAYLIPYGRECTVQVSYKGFCQLAYRVDAIKKAWCYPVWDGELFEMTAGMEPKLIHVPDITDEERESSLEELRGAYACVKLLSDEVDWEWMNLATIMKIRGKSSAWQDWPVEMAKIRPLKRLMKRQRMTEQTMGDALALDDREGKPRDPKVELEGEVIEVQSPLKEEFDAGVEAAKAHQKAAVADIIDVETKTRPPNRLETREEINAGIEKAWTEFHAVKLNTGLLEMDREYVDYRDPSITSDGEAWKFRDRLIRETLRATSRK